MISGITSATGRHLFLRGTPRLVNFVWLFSDNGNNVVLDKKCHIHNARHDLNNTEFRRIHTNSTDKKKPSASEVLTCYLTQTNFPPWTSYFIKYESIVDDQWGGSHFNWTVKDGHNYHILRTGCYPYIKYHCTKRPYQDLKIEDTFFRVIKVLNLGLPCLAYGVAATFLLKGTQAYVEDVLTSKGIVTIYFLYKEDKGSMY